MNQQRSRRFRSALDAKIKADEEERQKEEMERRGETIIEPTKEKVKFDSNCITPGTPFMDKLSKYLKYYVNDRLNNNPGWKGVYIKKILIIIINISYIYKFYFNKNKFLLIC